MYFVLLYSRGCQVIGQLLVRDALVVLCTKQNIGLKYLYNKITMKQSDYYVLGIATLNIFLLLQIYTAYTVTNIIAATDHHNVFGYLSLFAVVTGVFLVLRNLLITVSYLSGNYTEDQTKKMVHTMAIGSFVAVISLALLFSANVQIFYFFNSLELQGV